MGRQSIRRALALAVVLAMSGGARPLPPPPSTFNRAEDVNELRALETALAQETDIDAAVRHYAPNAVVATVMAPGWHAGTFQVRRALSESLAGVRRIDARFDELNIASNGTLACAAAVVRYQATLGNGTTRTTSVRQLNAWRKIGTRWRIVQQQVSVPADMASGRPLLDGPLVGRGPLAWAPVAPAERQNIPGAMRDIREWLKANIIPITVDGALETYGPSDDVVLFDVAAPRGHRGLAELRSYFGPMLGGVARFEYRIPAFTIDTDGLFGVQISRLDLKMNMKKGPPQYISFRQSDCLRRIGDKWFPFFEMGSFPVDPATGKAIMARPEVFR